MRLDSIDDKYEGCAKNMTNLVNNIFFPRENESGSFFERAWSVAMKQPSCENPGNGLTKSHCIALYVYTGDAVYHAFNSAVRNGRTAYSSWTYQWYSFHFFLTEAVQILQPITKCKKTYRRTNVKYDKDVKNTKMRFGQFASSSLSRDINLNFGSTSCFQINTCHGAYISEYSIYAGEEEVLIPPYETFVITDVLSRITTPDLWCETVYVLESTGTRSDLNCAVAAGRSLIEHSYKYVWVAFVSVITLIHSSHFGNA